MYKPTLPKSFSFSTLLFICTFSNPAFSETRYISKKKEIKLIIENLGVALKNYQVTGPEFSPSQCMAIPDFSDGVCAAGKKITSAFFDYDKDHHSHRCQLTLSSNKGDLIKYDIYATEESHDRGEPDFVYFNQYCK